jgi:hypothetical protein
MAHRTSAPAAAPQRREEALRAQFQGWLQKAQSDPDVLAASGADRPDPVFIVTSGGGGIRSAYWTGTVLAHAVQATGSTGLCCILHSWWRPMPYREVHLWPPFSRAVTRVSRRRFW